MVSPLTRGLRLGALIAATGVRIIPARAGFTPWRGPGRSRAADHPRSRGVYRAGSTPAARRPWIIPARAGFTPSTTSWPGTTADHPRSRGVYRRGRRARSNCCGSSPLARGLLSVEVNASERAGIIPARAGFTRQAHPGRRGQGDHPRSRGVYPASSSGTPGARGSSPLARGLRRRGRFGGLRRGIIPARAGFTGGSALPYHHETDHPRSRGVYSAASLASWRMAGSSPLARGLHRRLRRQCEGPRIIPARAGFTRRAHRRRHLRPDHPRSRGVYRRRSSVKRWRGGSSPLARGLPVLEPPGHLVLGIIPARAGFTIRLTYHSRPRTDHPRSRGVYVSVTRQEALPEGSSPLARGLPWRERIVTREDRIIPARAGFTTRCGPRRTTSGSSPLARGLRRAARSASRRRRDHPRSRGVYVLLTGQTDKPIGSSPLARGLRGRPAR